MKKKKDSIEFRRYDLSGNEPIRLMNVRTWEKCYPDGARILHFHNLTEIGFCHEGDGYLVINDTEYPFRNDMISVIPSNMPHGTFSDNDQFGHWHYLFFDAESIVSELWGDNRVFVKEFLDRMNQSGFFFPAGDQPMIRQVVELIIEEYENKPPFYCESIRGLLRSLVLQIYRLNADRMEGDGDLSKYGDLIKTAIRYIGEHASSPLKIGMVADACGLSEVHFRRIFKQIMHMSALEYIQYVRIQKACELLSTTDKPMTEISDLVGYDSISTFNRNFGRIVGRSPYQWKKDPDNHKSQLLDFKISSLKGW